MLRPAPPRSTIACSVIAATVSLLGVAPQARADLTPAERTTAEGLFKEGKKLLKDGKVAEACEKLASSYRIDPAAGTLINLAACHELEGKTATAWAEFTDSLALANKAGNAERRQAAQQHIGELEPKLSKLTLTARGPHDQIEVKLDGVVMAAGALGTPLPVDPGDHTLEASSPGKIAWSRTVTIRPSEVTSIDVPELKDLPLPPPPAPPEATGLWKVPVGATLVGVGAASLVAGIAFGVRAVVLGGDVATACHNGACSQTGLGEVNDGKTAATASNVLVPVGAVLGGAGAILLVFPQIIPDGKPRATQGRLRVRPVMGPGLFLLSMDQTW